MAGKPIRLGKAASELNIGVSTLVEFLESKGMKIDSNPNTKLEEDQMSVLRAEFASDVELKEQSKSAAAVREKKETVTIKDTREVEPVQEEIEDEEDAPINLEEIKRSVMEPVSTDANPKVNIVGKIDLASLNQKTKPDKKSTKEPEKIEEIVPEVVTEVKIEAPIPVDAPVEIETIRVERKVLSGPTVLGKMNYRLKNLNHQLQLNQLKISEERESESKKLKTPLLMIQELEDSTKDLKRGKLRNKRLKRLIFKRKLRRH
jgi:translation initiation factor IF-2